MSFAAVYRLAVRDALRLEIARAIDAVYRATHAAEYQGKVYQYGSHAECVAFATGLSRVTVREFTDAEKHREALHKRQVYGNP